VAEGYRIIGAEMSPYSVKVRSYFRYKGIPHQWVLRNAASQAEYEKHAKMPIIPLVITPEGTGIQDSTPIIDQMEKRFPDPPIHPGEPVTRFVSALIEEFGDEWGNKWMFHHRWGPGGGPALFRRAHRADACTQGERGRAHRFCRSGAVADGR
jgi:glutathione S-transferase